MTTTYQATDKECEVCGEPVEDYVGHWEASEMAVCEECYEKAREQVPSSIDVVHRVPKKGQSP